MTLISAQQAAIDAIKADARTVKSWPPAGFADGSVFLDVVEQDGSFRVVLVERGGVVTEQPS